MASGGVGTVVVNLDVSGVDYAEVLGAELPALRLRLPSLSLGSRYDGYVFITTNRGVGE